MTGETRAFSGLLLCVVFPLSAARTKGQVIYLPGGR